MTTITIALPLPPKALGPNGRLHWSRRAALIRQHRGDAKYAALAVLGAGHDAPLFPSGVRVRVAATIHLPPRRTPMDDDNVKALCKAYLDGFTDAGIWADDRQALWGAVAWRPEAASRPLAPGTIALTLTDDEEARADGE